MYFGATVGVTALSAVAVSRNPRLMGMMMKNSWMVCMCFTHSIIILEQGFPSGLLNESHRDSQCGVKGSLIMNKGLF